MQPVLSARMYRLLKRTPTLWLWAGLVALNSMYTLVLPYEIGCMDLAPGNTILPLAAALLCVAYDSAGFDSGELRNCLVTGRTRLAAYGASLVALMAGTLVICAVYYVPFILAGELYGWIDQPESIARMVIGGVLSTVCLLCAFHALAMRLVRPIPMLAGIGIFLVACFALTLILMEAVTQPEMVPMYEFNETTGFETYLGTFPNPDYPTDEEFPMLLFWVHALPTSLMSWNQDPDPGFFIGSAVDGTLFALLGFLAFRRQNVN